MIFQWKKVLNGNYLISRWGHSSVVYQNKVYLFAGRSSNDLNDLILIENLGGELEENFATSEIIVT
jgi:hypothetical protein